MLTKTQASRRASNAKYKTKMIEKLGGVAAYREDQARRRREWYAKRKEKRMTLVEDVEHVALPQKATEARREVSFVSGGKANVKILIAWEKALVDAGIVVVTKKTPIHKHAYLTGIFSTLAKVHLGIFGTQWNCDTFEWMKDWPRLYDALKKAYQNRKTLSTQIGKVVGLLRWLRYQGPDWIPVFTEAQVTMCEHGREVASVRANNVASADEKANSLPWEEMVALLDGITDVHDKFLYGYQVLFAPRRLDIRFLALVDNPNATLENLRTDASLSDELNFYIKVSPEHAFFVFKKYKTRPIYGVQVFVVTPKLRTLANAYIETYKLKDGDPFFKPGLNFSGYMRQMYERVTGKPHMLQNYVRHSFSTWLSREFQNKSVTARMAWTDRMAHNVMDSELYKRVNM